MNWLRDALVGSLVLLAAGSFARGQEVQLAPVAIAVRLGDLMPYSVLAERHCLSGFLRTLCMELPRSSFDADPGMLANVMPFPSNVPATLPPLGEYLIWCMQARYESKGATAGYYIGDARSDHTFPGMPGFRIRAVMPSEVFRDSATDWDQFEVVASLLPIGPGASADTEVTMLILAVNYSRRSRGGISFGAGPSPDWDFDALDDLEATNGRLAAIQDGIRQVAAGGRASFLPGFMR